MAQELIYTSTDKGLRPGSRGFCTVAHTHGMLPQSIQLLEALCAYKGNHPPLENSSSAPVAWSHLMNNLAGRNTSIISRIGSTSPDHTGRSNKLAHHVIIQARERCLGGPAWLCMQPDFLLDAWDDSPHLIDLQKDIPQGNPETTPAYSWERITGNPANAAILPEAFLKNPDCIVLIAYNEGMDMLPLIAESLALLPPASRWKVTFNTYFSTLPAGSTCNWRCCLANSDILKELKRNPRAITLDLTGPEIKPPTGQLAEIARTGRAPEPLRTPVQRNSASKDDLVSVPANNLNMLTLKPRKY